MIICSYWLILTPAESATTNDKPTSIVFIPYTQTTYGQLSRMLAKCSIKSVALPPRKIFSYLPPVKDALVLTHLSQMFHYWNGCNGVIYILLLKVIAESDFFTRLPPEGTCYHVVHRADHCSGSCRAGSLLKK